MCSTPQMHRSVGTVDMVVGFGHHIPGKNESTRRMRGLEKCPVIPSEIFHVSVSADHRYPFACNHIQHPARDKCTSYKIVQIIHQQLFMETICLQSAWKITQPIESITLMQLNDIKTFISLHGQIKTDYIKLIYISNWFSFILTISFYLDTLCQYLFACHLQLTFCLRHSAWLRMALRSGHSVIHRLHCTPIQRDSLSLIMPICGRTHTPSECRGKPQVTTYIWIHQCCRKNSSKDVRCITQY